VRFISAPYRSRRRLVADNDGALSVLTASIGARSERWHGAALFDANSKAGSHIAHDARLPFSQRQKPPAFI
jgi:hypothetical protein